MKPAIGMSVPGASDLGLGLGGPASATAETEEEKRKRLLKAQQERLLPSLGAADLLNGYGAAGGIGGGI